MGGELRLAILGCGEITRLGHLPAAAAHPAVRVAWLIDSDVSRARSLAEYFHVDCQVASGYNPALHQVDALINALPNHLHTPLNLEALNAGVHLLCEKPLSTTAADARLCCELAEKKSLLLAVGMNRRFVGAHKLLPVVLREGTLGELIDYDWSNGGVFDWNSASGFYFSRAQAGGGALIDAAVHMLDSLMDWFGPVVQFDYQDDDWGSGIEANAILDLQHRGQFGVVKGRVRVSRTYPLPNRLLIRGTKAEAEVPLGAPDTVVIHRLAGEMRLLETLRLPDFENTSTFYRQLDNFVESIRVNQKLESDGWQALQVIGLIEQCYAKRRRIGEPWSEIALIPDGAVR